MKKETARIATKKFCEHVKKEGVKDALIFLYGGEPLINLEAIKACVDEIHNSNADVKLSMVSNGTLLDEEIAHFLKDNNIDVGVSIDGTKELHDRNRPFRFGNIGSYEKANMGINNLNSIGGKCGLSITISKEFLKHQDEVLTWIKNKNINGIFYNMLHYCNYDPEWEYHSKKTAEYIIKSYEKFKNSKIEDGRLNRQITSIKNRQFLFSDCAAVGCAQFVVMPDGHITICHGDSNTDKHIVGNIDNIDITDIFNTDEAKAWSKRSTVYNDFCLNCEAIYCCGGGCKQQAEVITGSRDNIDKTYCIYVKEVLQYFIEACYDR